MSIYRSFLIITQIAVLFLLTSCATPIGPTGGPRDRTGPVVEKMVPESGTTNFEGRKFEFHFDEYVRRSSVPAAVTIEPDFGGNYELSWKRKKLTLTFDEALPDSTTVIIKLGTAVTDTRNNKLSSPITLAVSTGDEIDSGRIRGRVLQAKDGKAAADQRVLLYREPFDFSQRARYQAQTDTGGFFNFSYLAAGTYKAVLIEDRNRNKTWDQSNESAFPFFREEIVLADEGSDTLDVIYTIDADTLAPEILGVGLFSTQRLRMRFSESIMFNQDSRIQISDSLGNAYTEAYPLYISPKESFVLFGQSMDPLLEDVNYELQVENITDMAGNSVTGEPFSFTGSAQEDTTLQRIMNANDATGLLQNEAFRVRYAAPISETEVLDSLVVIEGDVDFQEWPTAEIRRNILEIRPQEEWIEGVEYQFLVWNPITQRRNLYTPQIWDSTEYGDLEIVINNADSSETYQLELQDEKGNTRAKESFTAGLTLDGLPPLSYTLSVYRDDNQNGKWDRGSVIPYRAPEPYYVQQNVNVQEGFVSEVTLSFD